MRLTLRFALVAGFAALALPAMAQAGSPVPGMTLPTDPYQASSPLSRVHVPLAERIAHGAGPNYPHHPSVHNGSGPMDYMALFDGRADTAKFNIERLHRRVF